MAINTLAKRKSLLSPTPTFPGANPLPAINPGIGGKPAKEGGLSYALSGQNLGFSPVEKGPFSGPSTAVMPPQAPSPVQAPAATTPPASPFSSTGLPANFGFNDLAGYEEQRRREFGTEASKGIVDAGAALRANLEKQYAARRSSLASSLTDYGKQQFDLQNPAILEDLNNRGVFTSPTAVANAQAQALKEISLANSAKLNEFDSQQFNDLTGIDKNVSDSSTLADLQSRQDALDAGLDLRRGGLDARLQENQSSREEALARELADKQSRNALTGSLIGAGSNILGNSNILGGGGGGGGVGSILSKLFGGGGGGTAAPAAGGIPSADDWASFTKAPGAGAPAAGGLASALPLAGLAMGGTAGYMALPDKAKAVVAPLVNPVKTVGSIGKAVSKAFCFDPYTPVTMADGSEKVIGEMKLDDKTKGGTVISVRRSKADEGTVRYYQGVFVTDRHAVKENGTWIRVGDSDESKTVTGFNQVVSLVTTDHRIFVKGIEFADEHETDDYEMLTIDQSLDALNSPGESIVEVSINGI